MNWYILKAVNLVFLLPKSAAGETEIISVLREVGENHKGRPCQVDLREGFVETLKKIVDETLETPESIFWKSRKNASAFLARARLCYELHENLGFNYSEIGLLLHGRDHTSIGNAIRKYKEKFIDA